MGKSRKSRASATTSSKQTTTDQETQRFEEAQKILDTPNVVTCVKKAGDLVVLCGPIYTKLVIEFWKNAVCNDYYVVSHVLDRKIVISEESIAKLLGMEFQQGKRIKNVDANIAGMKTKVNKEIYDNWSQTKTKYGIKDLKPLMKIWQKIFIYYIHPRTGGTDYLNATQKVIMYYISTSEPICLPFLLFNYLKECIEKSRTTASENKRSISYIPYGRLLSDIFVQNKLVKTLSDLGLHEDLTMSIGDALNGTKLKRMQIIEKVQVEPSEDTSEEVRQRNYPVDDFPLWSRKDNPASILEYVRMLRRNGDKITLEEFVKTLPESPPEMPTRRSKKTTSKPSDPKGKGILIEEPKRKKAASKSVVIRESVPEPSPKRTPEESYEESQSDVSESSEKSLEESSKKEDDDVHILEPPFNVEPLQQVASNFEDQLQVAPESSYVSLSNYSAVNSRDLSFTSPEKTATSRPRQVTISEAEHMDESDHSEAEVATHAPATEVPTSAPAPEVTTLAARIDRIQDDQQRLFQMVEQPGLVQIEQSRQIQESSRRMEDMMKFLIEHFPSSSKP
ncbi:uncharacterized protein LOC130712486 [Lotus japonicus]|uniref:uncharacterized protein LOC130712486 n=1 Tax=Lotus japonicus TaxID=34305 RepID=UPI00258B0671|nr:uncharacterized protein LOC130712486 [Lotus japonicus]